MLKVCLKCGEEKDDSLFHKNPEMASGRLNTCSKCVSEYDKKRILRLKQDPEWVKKQKELSKKRSYERYHKGIRDNPEGISRRVSRWNTKNPEKRRAASAAGHKINCDYGYHRHHWSYKQENWLDVFIITNKEHRLIHHHLKYKQEFMCYESAAGELLDTREKHEKYIALIIQAEKSITS